MVPRADAICRLQLTSPLPIFKRADAPMALRRPDTVRLLRCRGTPHKNRLITTFENVHHHPRPTHRSRLTQVAVVAAQPAEQPYRGVNAADSQHYCRRFFSRMQPLLELFQSPMSSRLAWQTPYRKSSDERISFGI